MQYLGWILAAVHHRVYLLERVIALDESGGADREYRRLGRNLVGELRKKIVADEVDIQQLADILEPTAAGFAIVDDGVGKPFIVGDEATQYGGGSGVDVD